MKTFIALGLMLTFAAWAETTKYAPNDGTASPGNPGTGLSSAPTTTEAMPTTKSDPTIEENENLDRANTTPNPIPSDTTLQGRTSRQSQEAVKDEVEEEVDVRTSPGVDHSKTDTETDTDVVNP